jgi:Domain of unknown function (DUF4193)
MATDYDAPRKTDDDLSEDSLEELKARRVDKTASAVDEDETEAAEGFELPCSVCFLVHHRSQLAGEKAGQLICKECAA